MCNCLRSYINNWPTLRPVVVNNKDGNTESKIKEKVMNWGIKKK